jgi:phytoene dehydrogenase-like protein
MEHTEHRFDAILIGSGIGCLTAASVLAQLYKKRVLLLERHSKLGGFTHTFKRQGKFEWDVGLHYVGEMAKGSMVRAVSDLMSGGKVRWQAMPDTYDVFVYPGYTFRARAGKSRLRNDLIRDFPDEADAINGYFRDVQRAVQWLGRRSVGSSLPSLLSPVGSLLSAFGSGEALLTTRSYLDGRFRDDRLKAVLVSQWGDYGLPPGMSAFVLHAMIASHYMGGAYYPIGGAASIAAAVRLIIEASGGRTLANHSVDEILVKDGKAVGVKAVHKKAGSSIEKTFLADTVISGVGALLTYTKLLPSSDRIPFRKEIDRFPKGTSHVTLYVGFKDDPRLLGVNGENYWFYDSFDHDEAFADRNALVRGQARHCYLSFPSLKNPKSSGHTAEVIAFIGGEPFDRWSKQSVKKRDEEYQQLKGRISDALLRFVDERIPGFRDLIEYAELSTPLSNEHYTGYPGGYIYGTPGIPERYRKSWIGFKTPIQNLFMVGADSSIHGITGAMMSGAVVAGIVMGSPKSLMHIFRAAKEFSASLPS